MVEVKIMLPGAMADSNDQHFKMKVNRRLDKAIEYIYQFIFEKWGIESAQYMLVYNNNCITSYIKKNNNSIVKTGDVFKVILRISGG